jgi:hypothetical protein
MRPTCGAATSKCTRTGRRGCWTSAWCARACRGSSPPARTPCQARPQRSTSRSMQITTDYYADQLNFVPFFIVETGGRIGSAGLRDTLTGFLLSTAAAPDGAAPGRLSAAELARKLQRTDAAVRALTKHQAFIHVGADHRGGDPRARSGGRGGDGWRGCRRRWWYGRLVWWVAMAAV